MSMGKKNIPAALAKMKQARILLAVAAEEIVDSTDMSLWPVRGELHDMCERLRTIEKKLKVTE